MSFLASPRFLRNVLWIDAATGAAVCLLHLLAGGLLAALLGLSPALVAASGLALLACVALASYAACCDPVPRAPVVALVVGNWLWAAACLGALFAGAATNVLGQSYLVVQALAVIVLAELEWIGLRRRPASGWA